ncbi:hypothetical protein MUGA111182_06630 [Mucilaginibacter galii]|uniref:Uncharacterized protein n=1 Tax=Mucilaginibacter galii TaxID=2005073 RepID=A0A917JBQ0_9SPHI|nr:hypothetical protein [Mucilaginibacter galii]GGI51672.1 hypothetical protein GCM10011425_28840 [Mucilaginibacter galii]
MVKNWIHILLSFWLINSVTYFHASSPADFANSEHSASAQDTCVKVNTWADCIIQSFVDNDDDAATKFHRIKHQRRYVRSRSANNNVFVPAPNFYFYYQHLKNAILAKVNHYSIGIALLPSYYNFLFRLCPF